MTTLRDLIPEYDGPPPARIDIECKAKSHETHTVTTFELDDLGEVGVSGLARSERVRWRRIGRDLAGPRDPIDYVTEQDRPISLDTTLHAAREVGPLRRREPLRCDLCGDDVPARAEKLDRCLDRLHGQGVSLVDLTTLRTMLTLI